ncbi:amino acid ABC transporter permease [uncultured Treponema sp.]|uniref:amino acid ABC transporter permease n=1 Tax=uncultured Treponema sp. TaxID=162155 RepID=UPI0015B01504|nr:amino acid ABC transporter permease [uncultured Treponema sp.]
MNNQGLLYWLWYIFKNYWNYFLKGTVLTLEIAILGTILGYILGFAIGLVQATPIAKGDGIGRKIVYRVLKPLCSAFVAVFRGTPMMVQAMVFYYGLKNSGIDISPFLASLIVLMMNTGAYMAETVRGGIISIDKGQLEGGFALGMSHTKTMFCVILPQAFRNIVPEMVNQFLTNLKMTSVLNVIGVYELYFATKSAAGIYYRYFESYIICAIFYFIICSVFTKILKSVEKKAFEQKDYELAVQYMGDSAE